MRGGDTLQSIAANLWGDGAMWYLLASANGLTGGESLVAGQSLIVPDRVTNIHNNASTFEVYDPNRALGDLSPTTPKPPKKPGKCGVIGMILMVAIAVAVTVVTAGAAVAALTPGMSLLTGISTFAAGTAGFGTMVAAGAVGGAMGSIASQGFGIATGLQDKFSWKGVAMGTLSGAVGAGVGASGAFARVGSTFLKGALTGATSSALSQGIGVATGLQDKFSWMGVATAGLGGGVGASVGKALGAGPLSDMSARNIGVNLATSAASAMANAAARSLIQGSNFGDNLMAALPDVIGGTIGNLIVGGVQGSGSRGTTEVAGEGVVLFGEQVEPGTGNENSSIVVTARDPARPSEVSDEDIAKWRSATDEGGITGLRMARDDRIEQIEEIRWGARGRELSRLEQGQIATRESQIATLEVRIADLDRIHAALIRDATGRVVQVNGEDYTIRGPNAVGGFASRRDVAIDGIALSYHMSSRTGDPFERGAMIERVDGDMFNYSTVVVGTLVTTEDRKYTLRNAQGEIIRHTTGENAGRAIRRSAAMNVPFLYLVGERGAGFFHIHPRGTTSEETGAGAGRVTHNRVNAGFSDVDENTFKAMRRYSWESYLGGSDGSFRVMRWDQNRRFVEERIGSRNRPYFDATRIRRRIS